jgi:hypothetical protein
MHVTFFVDEAGNPSLKDSTGAVTPAITAGTPLQLNEQASTPPVVGNAVKIYSKDVSGRSEFFVLNDTDGEVQITSAGAIPMPDTPFQLAEAVTPPQVPNTVKIYAKDVSGRSEFFAINDTDSEVQITNQGAINVQGSIADTVDDQTLQTTLGAPVTIATYSTLADERAISMRCRVWCREPTTDDSGQWVFENLFNRDDVSLVTSKDESVVALYKDQGAWDVTFNISSQDIEVQVTGEVAKTIEWRCQLEVSEHG